MTKPKFTMDFNNLSSGITHLCGAFLALPCATLLIFLASRRSAAYVAAFSIFGASLFLLYAASALYHFVSLAPIKTAVFRRIDHMMIFILIAGTYTPICLIALNGALSVGLLAGIWVIALLGVLFKIFWLSAPRLLYTLLYVGMGWIAVTVMYPLSKTLSPAMLGLLIGGGVTYTAGAVFYALKKPKLRAFGFHEIFHLFVLGGSACHIVLMFFLVVK